MAQETMLLDLMGVMPEQDRAGNPQFELQLQPSWSQYPMKLYALQKDLPEFSLGEGGLVNFTPGAYNCLVDKGALRSGQDGSQLWHYKWRLLEFNTDKEVLPSAIPAAIPVAAPATAPAAAPKRGGAMPYVGDARQVSIENQSSASTAEQEKSGVLRMLGQCYEAMSRDTFTFLGVLKQAHPELGITELLPMLDACITHIDMSITSRMPGIAAELSMLCEENHPQVHNNMGRERVREFVRSPRPDPSWWPEDSEHTADDTDSWEAKS